MFVIPVALLTIATVGGAPSRKLSPDRKMTAQNVHLRRSLR
jgi:hypothetical protein